MLCVAGSLLYCSMYSLQVEQHHRAWIRHTADHVALQCSGGSVSHRTVAPDEPVPDRRKMILDPSVNTKRRPCLAAVLPSTGSV